MIEALLIVVCLSVGASLVVNWIMVDKQEEKEECELHSWSHDAVTGQLTCTGCNYTIKEE